MIHSHMLSRPVFTACQQSRTAMIRERRKPGRSMSRFAS
jgi:hypothetical protein